MGRRGQVLAELARVMRAKIGDLSHALKGAGRSPRADVPAAPDHIAHLNEMIAKLDAQIER
jgi:hypothetical protein